MSMGQNDYRNNDPQKRKIFKYRRAGIVLTQSEVEEIKAGRKKLRAEMKLAGVYTHQEFELTASSLGLYFDKNRFFALLLWLFHGRALWAVLGAALLFMAAMYGIAQITQLRGHFTINLTDEMFDEGFQLSETSDFVNPTARLYGEPVEDAPCISVTEIPADVDAVEGPHNGRAYYAHTFFLAKRGEGTADYRFTLSINSESLNCSTAAWVMLYHEGVPTLYARMGADGEAECLPAKGDNSRGYAADSLPFLDRLPANQYEEVVGEKSTGIRLMPYPFATEQVITSQVVTDMEQDEVDAFTVVIWLEGDDPDCTDALIGSHIGLQMDFELMD